ncbi:glycerate kinase [Arthrobacter woluwensis]|uniref:Glycerate kinase n=1 Tax=Arthrobacter woluwensis TaxID=156980 RepID=A0A1H4L2A9_9MICC|nr:glycerate kinase [Arthrobacter woluwensis]SEB64518.1 glycerate kinase [Arthrobacter woluwensis]
MRIVIAPDKFKGSLSAPEVVAHLETGLRAVDGSLDIVGIPVADGGEGTLDAAIGSGFSRRTVRVAGPTGQPLNADFALRDDEAVIEMALASGLAVLPGGVKDGRGATSLGTGQLIRAALDAGARTIVLGVGGSANTDGGAGVIKGLGGRFLDASGAELPDGGAALAALDHIDLSGLDVRLERTRFILASDVDNPLLGSQGAPAVFGPQKGLSPEDVTELDATLAHFVEVLGREIGLQASTAAAAPGAGAAGGVGYAALAVLNAERRRGVDVVLDFTGLSEKLDGATLVITGEGSLDEQSLGGKTPMGVADAARAAGVPVVAVCGRTTLTDAQISTSGIQAVYSLTSIEEDVEKCITQAGPLVEKLGGIIANSLIKQSN